MDIHPDAAGASLFAERYVLGELLGVGGSASVFTAHDTRPEPGEPSTVALKLLHPHLAHEESARQAFLREAQRAATLVDVHIPRVRGAGLQDAGGVVQPWIALDLVAGPTLRDRVREGGPLSPTDAAAVVDGVLAAVAAAHAVGVVHRDLSPQNVMLAVIDDETLTASCVRVLDFGLADVTGRTTVGQDVLLSAPDAEGHVIGNAHYMSPEQAQGQPVRTPSDLYQVGAVLYFALTGQPPFPRRSVADVLAAHAFAPPPVPSALVPAARPFDRIVTRAMTKTPARRFRDAAEFRAALADAARLLTAAPGANQAAAGAPGAESVSPDDRTTDEADPGKTGATRVLSPARGGLGVPAFAVEAPPSVPGGAAPPSTSPGFVAVVVALVLIAGVGVWVSISDAAGSTPDAANTPTTAASSPPPEPSPSPTPPAPQSLPPAAPETVGVPALSGTLADAERMLRDAGLVLGDITRVESPWAAETVLRHVPEAGAVAERGSAVAVTVASGHNVVPSVVGLDVATARNRLQAAGFSSSAGAAIPDAVVVATSPEPGTTAAVGTVIALEVASRSSPTPTPTSTPVQPSPTATTGAPG